MTSTLVATIITILTVSSHLSLPLYTPTQDTQVAPLASRTYSLADRYPVPSVAEVFKKNILLNLAYLEGRVTSKQDLNWETITQESHYTFTLKPGEVFAFHDGVLPEYKEHVTVTTNAHFNSREGFISDGYLVGDGVCHFASFINWVAQDAGLDVLVTKNHDFAAIPDVPKKYGVSIYVDPNQAGSGSRNNLYVTNNKSHNVVFHFDYVGTDLKISVSKDSAI